jgi:hypothetical protein
VADEHEWVHACPETSPSRNQTDEQILREVFDVGERCRERNARVVPKRYDVHIADISRQQVLQPDIASGFVFPSVESNAAKIMQSNDDVQTSVAEGFFTLENPPTRE